MKDISGRWRVESGPRSGQIYHFRPDGSFELVMGSENLRAAGRYRVRAETAPFEIDLHYVQHAIPEELGLVRGVFNLDSEKLHLKLSPPDYNRWMGPQARLVCARA